MMWIGRYGSVTDLMGPLAFGTSSTVDVQPSVVLHSSRLAVAHGVAMCRARAKGMEERCCEALRLQHRLSRITGQIDARKCYSKPRAKEKRAEPAPAIGANARALRRSIVSAAWDVVRAGIPDRHTP